MFGWEYNKKMIETYMTDHAEDMGRFWAKLCLDSPKVYGKFMKGYIDGISNREQEKK